MWNPGSNRRLPALAAAVLALFCAMAAAQTTAQTSQDQDPNQRCRDRQKAAEAQSQTTLQNDPQLAKIDEFEIDLSKRISGVQSKGSQPIQVIINPFAARKRARFYGSVYEYHRNDNFDAPNYFDKPGRAAPRVQEKPVRRQLRLFCYEKALPLHHL